MLLWWERCCWAQTMESRFRYHNLTWIRFGNGKVTIQLQVDGTTTHKTSKPIEMTNVRVHRTTQLHLSHTLLICKWSCFCHQTFFSACFSACLFCFRAVYLCLSPEFFPTSVSYYALFGVRVFFFTLLFSRFIPYFFITCLLLWFVYCRWLLLNSLALDRCSYWCFYDFIFLSAHNFESRQRQNPNGLCSTEYLEYRKKSVLYYSRDCYVIPNTISVQSLHAKWKSKYNN